jgi:hypothetical protein
MMSGFEPIERKSEVASFRVSGVDELIKAENATPVENCG